MQPTTVPSPVPEESLEISKEKRSMFVTCLHEAIAQAMAKQPPDIGDDDQGMYLLCT